MTDERDESQRLAGLVNLPPCAACGYVQDALSPAFDETAKPSVGSLLVCLACGALTTVDEAPSLGLYVRPLTAAEHREALTDPGLVKVLETRAVMAQAYRAAGREWPGERS